ncbi:phosphatase PAP2 family protein [Seonamhaeicola marinus]|uniref:Phosphatase PAP2 family protein n=1 Tax=Seonamhaeicola marinus TaxID=1912246 RepID=A0A5D0JL65_9FLAO|nr:phosphatase PAP2 family protein [Seonamhaeicola marinus]TYA94792.1 phosphatase PAP2 family protein [Seonamhaeicola marinus]
MIKNRLFNVVSVFLVLLLLVTPLLIFEKGTVLLFINKNHSPALDGVFKTLSSIGNGVSIAIVGIILLLFFKVKRCYQFLLSFLIQLFIILLFKKGILHGSLRPFKYFGSNQGTIILNLVEGVKIRRVGTFPSGHTATIFFITTFLALWLNNKATTISLFVLAFFVGASRIYLVQHFFFDVYFGAFFGVLSSVVSFYIVNRYHQAWYSRFLFPNALEVFNKPILQRTPKFR